MNTDYSAYVPDVIFEKIPIKNLVSCQTISAVCLNRRF